MNLTETLQQKLENPKLSTNDRIFVQCQAAEELIYRGQYEAARDALGNLWRGVGRRPDMEGITGTAEAEVLLQCGALQRQSGNRVF